MSAIPNFSLSGEFMKVQCNLIHLVYNSRQLTTPTYENHTIQIYLSIRHSFKELTVNTEEPYRKIDNQQIQLKYFKIILACARHSFSVPAV